MEQLLKYILPLSPALSLFGPLLIVIGYDPANHAWADLGAIMTGCGVLLLFLKIMDQSVRIEELSRQVREKGAG